MELTNKFTIKIKETANPHVFQQVMAKSSRKYQKFSARNINQDHSIGLEFFKINPIKAIQFLVLVPKIYYLKFGKLRMEL